MYYTKIVIDMMTGEVLEKVAIPYSGPVELCKGNSGQEQSASNESALAAALTANMNTLFSENQAILKALTPSLEAIVKAGPNQTGFSNAEAASLMTGARDFIAQGGRNAIASTQNEMVQSGMNDLPSGVKAQIIGGINVDTAQRTATAQNAIRQANYATGRQNYWAASQALSGLTGQTGSMALGFGGQASSANQGAFQDYTTLYNQGNWFSNIVAPILGGAAKFGMGMATGGGSLAAGAFTAPADATYGEFANVPLGTAAPSDIIANPEGGNG